MFQMTSNREITKMKVVDLEKLYNFIVDNFFIWIRLESKTLISSSVENNMSIRNIYYGCKWMCGAVVRGGDARGRGRRFESRRPRGREFYVKKCRRWAGAGRWGAPPIKKIPIFRVFFGSNFAECRALGKGFAECPTKDTRQRRLCRPIFCRVTFAECSTRQSLCRI